MRRYARSGSHPNASQVLRCSCDRAFAWTAPYTEAADVYSYAMVAWEVLTRAVPFDGMSPVQVCVAVREQRLRPPLPDDCAPAAAALLGACWHEAAQRRPTFAKVLGRVQALVALSTESQLDVG